MQTHLCKQNKRTHYCLDCGCFVLVIVLYIEGVLLQRNVAREVYQSSCVTRLHLTEQHIPSWHCRKWWELSWCWGPNIIVYTLISQCARVQQSHCGKRLTRRATISPVLDTKGKLLRFSHFFLRLIYKKCLLYFPPHRLGKRFNTVRTGRLHNTTHKKTCRLYKYPKWWKCWLAVYL